MNIPLTQGKYAIIDDIDFALVSKYKWYWNKSRMQSGYAQTTIPLGRTGRRVGIRRKRTILMMHNLVSGLEHADHKNGDGLDNRRDNLRPATQQQQCHNRKPISGKHYKGVGYWHGKWRARIKVNGHPVFLGYFKTPEEAALAYNEAATATFGEYARLNMVTDGVVK